MQNNYPYCTSMYVYTCTVYIVYTTVQEEVTQLHTCLHLCIGCVPAEQSIHSLWWGGEATVAHSSTQYACIYVCMYLSTR